MNPLLQQITLHDQEFTAISRVVYDHCGINLTGEKKELVRSRLAKLIRKYNCSSYDEYLNFVLKDPSGPGFVEFIDRVSTNLTSFFREKRHFEYLQDTLLPRLMQAAPDPARIRLRGWSAGCSTGEEPYSLAMTLLETLPDVQQADVKILASDISMTVLEKAKDGYYPAERLETVSAALKKKYFAARREQAGPFFLAGKELKKILIFKQINLMQEWPLTTGLDFIFCRNVLIYFDKPTHQTLIARFHRLLKPGGVLFIGHSESLSGIQHEFKNISPAIYLKK
jgi:chemotaxis protein methyltransferase CheR